MKTQQQGVEELPEALAALQAMIRAPSTSKPVQKTHNGVLTPILHPDDHLIFDAILPQDFPVKIVTIDSIVSPVREGCSGRLYDSQPRKRLRIQKQRKKAQND